jgi:polar amino acid transport system permease protein
MGVPSAVLLVLWHTRRALLLGLGTTPAVSAVGLAVGLLIGVAGAVAGAFGGRWLRGAAALYMALLRGVPVLVTLFFLYYGVAAALGPMPAGIATRMALGLFAGAHLAETGRGALQSQRWRHAAA